MIRKEDFAVMTALHQRGVFLKDIALELGVHPLYGLDLGTGFYLTGQSIKLTAAISSIIILGDSFGAMALPWVTGQAIEPLGAQTMP